MMVTCSWALRRMVLFPFPVQRGHGGSVKRDPPYGSRPASHWTAQPTRRWMTLFPSTVQRGHGGSVKRDPPYGSVLPVTGPHSQPVGWMTLFPPTVQRGPGGSVKRDPPYGGRPASRWAAQPTRRVDDAFSIHHSSRPTKRPWPPGSPGRTAATRHRLRRSILLHRCPGDRSPAPRRARRSCD